VAGNEIKLTLRVDDKGSLSIVAKEAKAAAAGVDKLDRSTKSANKSRSNYQRVEKGVAGATSNSTKAFSKQAQAIGGGLVPAYAVLAANVFAITAAFGVLQRSAAVAQLKDGLIAVGNAAGQNLPFVASQLKIITGAAVSTEQAMRATAVAVSAGFSTDQLNQLAKVAKGASLALGRDMGDALDRLVRGTAKLEPEILDELGIMVRLDDAVTDYAIAMTKTASELTQFERRQAFLNATIEQGSKKFSEIAQVVEVNPYDKLSASFSDLSHDLIELVSKGLVPLIEILSSSPVALAGAMAAFGGSLVRTILPSIQATAESQRELAAVAIRSSRSAGKKVAANYLKLSKDINKMEMRPPSIAKLEKDFARGAVSAVQLKRNIGTVTGQLTKKANVVKSLKDLTDSASTARTTQLNSEIKQLTTLKERLVAVQNEESKRNTGTTKAKGLRGAGRMAKRESAGLQAIDSSSFAGGLGIAAKQSKRQFAEIGKASGAMNTVSAVFKTATSSAKMFGTAILRMIPFIGQLVFVASALSPLFSDLFKADKVVTATEDVIKSFNSFITIAERLNKVIGDDTATAFEKYFATLKVGVGILDQIASGLILINQVSQQQTQEELEKLSLSLVEARQETERLQKQNDKLVASGITNLALPKLNNSIREVAELEAQVAKLAQGLDKIDKVSTMASLTASIALLENTALGNRLPGELNGVKDILEKVNNGGITTGAQLADAFKNLSDSSKRVIAGVGGIQDSFKTLRDETQQFGAKTSTIFSKNTKAMRSFANEVNGAGSTVGGNLDEVAKGAEAEYSRVYQVLLKLDRSIDKVSTDSSVAATAFRVAADALEENESIMTQAAAQSAIYAEQAKQIGKFSKKNAFLMEKQLGFEKQATQEKLRGKKAESENFQIIDATNTQKEAYQKLTKEISLLELQIKDTTQETNLIATARVEGAKRLNDLLGKQLSMAKGILDARDKTSKIKIEARRGRSGSNAQDELDIFKSTKAERLALEQKLFEQKVKGIDIQYKLLDLQFELEGIKLSNIMKAQKAGDDEIASAMGTITAARTLTAAGRAVAMELEHAKIGAKYDPTKETTGKDGIVDPSGTKVGTSAVDALGVQKEIAAAREREAVAAGKAANQVKLMNMHGRELLGATLAEAEAVRQTGRERDHLLTLQAAENKTAGDLLAIEQQQVILEKAKTEEIRTRMALRQTEVDTVTRLQGAGAGAAMGTAAAMANSREEGGAFHKTKNEETGEEEYTSKLSERVKAMGDAASGQIEHLKSLGPEGAVFAAVSQGAFNIAESFTTAFETIETSSSKMEKVGAIMGAVGGAISAVGAIQAAKSKAAVAGVDKEIAAEQKRDGKSAASVAKIKQLEAKKEAIKKKAFEKDKKLKMAMVVMSTGQAIMKEAEKGFPAAIPGIAMMAAMGAMQLSAISSTSYAGGGTIAGAGTNQPSEISIGQRGTSTDLAKSKSAGGELAYFRGAQGQGGAENFRPAFTGAKYRANGGQTAGYMVGEQGPELFVPETPGTILPNDGDGMTAAPANVNFSISALDASGVEDILTQQRGNIIGMIREAANSYGQDFVEGVDTSVYTPSAGGVSKY